MGGEERARLGHAVSAASKLTAMVLTLAMLAGGIILAARYGDFSMRAGDSRRSPMIRARGTDPSLLALGMALISPNL